MLLAERGGLLGLHTAMIVSGELQSILGSDQASNKDGGGGGVIRETARKKGR